MDITPVTPKGIQTISGYGGGAFRIGGAEYAHSVLVLPAATLSWSGEMSLDALAPVVEAGAELLLIGGGKGALPVSAELRAALRARGIGIETMDTGAACRTYNVLASEGRSVAAALKVV